MFSKSEPLVQRSDEITENIRLEEQGIEIDVPEDFQEDFDETDEELIQDELEENIDFEETDEGILDEFDENIRRLNELLEIQQMEEEFLLEIQNWRGRFE